MTGSLDNFAWHGLILQPDITLGSSALFRALQHTRVVRVGNPLSWELVCSEPGLQLCIPLSAIQSQIHDELDSYLPSEALEGFEQAFTERPDDLLAFLRLSPWLLSQIDIDINPTSADLLLRHGAVLARLLDLLVTFMERHGLTNSRYADPYRLLLRARFLLLARLYEDHLQGAPAYLPNLVFELNEAWQAWGRILIASAEDLRIVFDRSGRLLEAEGSFLLFDDRKGKPWSFVADRKAHAFAEQVLRQWFLPRYDLRSVHAALAAWPGRWSWLRQLVLDLQVPGSLLILFLLGLPLVVGSLGSLYKPWLLGSGYLIIEQLVGGAIAYLAWLLAVLVVLGALIVLVVFDVHLLRYGVPRVTLAIIAGYLVLMSSSELMGMALLVYEEHLVLTWAIVLGSSTAALLALYLDVRRRLGDMEVWEARRRSITVLVIAAARSLTIGWLLLVPLGSLLLSGNAAAQDVHPWYLGAGWPVYPQLIFILAPLALFVGIFVQSIWQEDALSHPL